MKLAVEVVETSSLGDRSYLATDGEVAVVVDPQRDIDRVLALAGRLGVRITHVVETHLHNDYVSGGLALARVTGAAYLVAAAEDVTFARTPVSDGDEIAVSEHLRLRVLATPGHTFHHVSYVLEGGSGPEGVFTGGSLLFGTTGRPDLLGSQHAHELALAQHASTRRLADLLPDRTSIWPTHGFGSFCSASQTDAAASTIAQEKLTNPALRLAAEEFATETLAGLDAYPAYYAHMGVANAAGPDLVDLTPAHRADADELRRRVEAGEWVVDLRSRRAYSHRHLAGTISLGLDGPMVTWLGWLMPWGTPVTLLGESAEQVARAQRELARIGIDRPAAQATGTVESWAGGDQSRLGSTVTATFADLAEALAARSVTDGAAGTSADVHDGRGAPALGVDVVLDVRLANEWLASHIDGAVHIPLPELPARLGELPDGVVWVHCGSGYRAAAAVSLLARAGRRAVHVDENYTNAADARLPLITEEYA